MRIRPATAADEAAWRRLWAGYVAFYGATLPDDVTAATWARCLDAATPMLCRLACDGDAVVGFAVAVVHPGTWSHQPLCYLEDLFVSVGARGKGAGRALIDALAAEGRTAGWSRLYWQTKPDNDAAHRLYGTVGQRTDWVKYERSVTIR